MTADFVCFAAIQDRWSDSFLRDRISFDPQILIIIGALSLVTIGIFIWAAFFRKPGSHPHCRFRRHSPEPAADRTGEPGLLGRIFSRKRHRRRRRERPRNPTLAEAGGLPPVRSEEQPPNST